MNSWRSTDIEVYITGDKKEIGWVKLPVSKQEFQLKQNLVKLEEKKMT